MELLLLVEDDGGECVGAAPLFGGALCDDGELVCANASTVDTSRKPPATKAGVSRPIITVSFTAVTRKNQCSLDEKRALSNSKGKAHLRPPERSQPETATGLRQAQSKFGAAPGSKYSHLGVTK